jgi:glutamine amidotransferase PdxT
MKKRLFSVFVIVIVAYYFEHEYSRAPVVNEIGKPVNVMKSNEDNELKVDKEALSGLFLHPEVRDRKPVIVSIVGDFRKGKSFLLD